MRNLGIDTTRGLAITVMILANATPYVFEEADIPMFLRFIFSLAAPTFIFLSGYSLQLTLDKGKIPKNAFKRAFQVLFVGVLIDSMVWNIMPFQTFDVLYLISISLMILIGIRKWRNQNKWILLIIVILISILLPSTFPYRFTELDHALNIQSLTSWDIRSSLIRFFYDGWFPLFPWIGLVILGSLAKQHEEFIAKLKMPLFISGIVLLSTGLAIFVLLPELANSPRDGYLELFYPVKNSYWLIFIGIAALVSSLTCFKSFYIPAISESGSMSLFLYLIHSVIISYVLTPYFENHLNADPAFRYLTLITFCISLAVLSLILNKYIKRIKEIRLLKPVLYIFGF